MCLLLGDPDEHDLVGSGEAGQLLVHHVVFALALGEVDQRQVVGGGVVLDIGDELSGHRRDQRGRGDREPAVPHQVTGHLAGALQFGDEHVEIHPIDALDLELHMIGQHIMNRAR